MSTQTRIFPAYLTCPYCPAQAVPVHRYHYVMNNVQFPGGLRLKEYKCPANHTFFAREEKYNEADGSH